MGTAPPPACLKSTYACKPGQRGGTLIADDVSDLQQHRERMKDADGYRPEACPLCGRRLHAHDTRPRTLNDQPDSPEEDIRRYRCRPCRAVWQVLPAVIARYLHCTWNAVQSALEPATEESRATDTEALPRPASRTIRRWRQRLRSSAVVLTQAVSETGAAVRAVLGVVGIDCSRAVLLEALAEAEILEPQHKLQDLACWVHLLVPGLRLT